MGIRAFTQLHRAVLLALGTSAVLAAAPTASADIWSDGHALLDARYRIEYVDQDGFDKTALASTLRTRLGYQLGDYEGFSGLVSFQDNRVIGDTRYNDTYNGLTQYPVVADPADTELDQAYLSYAGVDSLNLKLGRQVVKLDNDRFVGNVGFRQLEQSFDALLASYDVTPDFNLSYAYVARVNRIFGAHHPDPLHARLTTDTHLLHADWQTGAGTLVGYAYLIGIDSLPAASHKDLGLRWVGKIGLDPAWNLDYTLEAARQSAYKDGTLDGSRDYLHAEAGLNQASYGVALGYERLEGDGTAAFQAPLATLHAFNGWTDRFLSTPADGLADSYLGAHLKAGDVTLKGTLHRFDATHGGSHYGDELDLALSAPLAEHLSGSVALGNYSADSYAVDTRIVWLTLEYKR